MATPKLSAPSMYRPVAAGDGEDPFDLACALARDGAEPATLVWTPGEDLMECAIVLGPEDPLGPSLLVALVAMVGIGDALGALIPPTIPVGFAWPDRILVSGATAGRLRIASADTIDDTAVPDWMVLGLSIAVTGQSIETFPNGGLHTALHAEGCEDVGAHDLLESFSRHFLYWMNRWQDDGFSPVRGAWLSRAAGYGENTDLEISGPWSSHLLLQLDAIGGIQYAEGTTEKSATLGDALLSPGWSP